MACLSVTLVYCGLTVGFVLCHVHGARVTCVYIGLERPDFEPVSHPDVFERVQREILRKQADTERKLDETQQRQFPCSFFVLKSSYIILHCSIFSRRKS